MVIASLICENISVFSDFENREKFSAQPKGLFLRNKRKMPRKIVAPATFVSGSKGRQLQYRYLTHFYFIVRQNPQYAGDRAFVESVSIFQIWVCGTKC